MLVPWLSQNPCPVHCDLRMSCFFLQNWGFACTMSSSLLCSVLVMVILTFKSDFYPPGLAQNGFLSLVVPYGGLCLLGLTIYVTVG